MTQFMKGSERHAQPRKMMKEIELSNMPYWTEALRELDVPHPNRLTIDNTHLKPFQTPSSSAITLNCLMNRKSLKKSVFELNGPGQ